MLLVPCKSNGKINKFEHNFPKIYRYLNLVKNQSIQRKFIANKKKSQVVTFKFCTEYEKYIYTTLVEL